MSRLSMFVAAGVLFGASAHADTFGGWHYAAPPGYAVEVSPDHVAFTKVTGPTFCSIALFEAKPLDGPELAARAYEWHNVVEHQFAASVKRRTTLQTKQGFHVAATLAAIDDADGAYAAIHYAVMPPGMIGSVLLTSTSAASIKACEPAAMSVLGSLAIDWSSPRFTDPEARVETPEGRWAVVGATSREYTFSADSSYRFHSETASAGRVVDETGTYTVVGNQLTLTPRRTTSAVIDGGIARSTTRIAADKTTYTWGKRYFADTNTWQLELTPTTRDGTSATATYSDHAKPAWKFASRPDA